MQWIGRQGAARSKWIIAAGILIGIVVVSLVLRKSEDQQPAPTEQEVRPSVVDAPDTPEAPEGFAVPVAEDQALEDVIPQDVQPSPSADFLDEEMVTATMPASLPAAPELPTPELDPATLQIPPTASSDDSQTLPAELKKDFSPQAAPPSSIGQAPPATLPAREDSSRTPAEKSDEEIAAAATSENPASSVEKKNEIRFQFDGVPYDAVIRRFAQMANKPLLGSVAVEGNLTFFDAQPYTYNDALDTLNLILAMQEKQLVEDGRFLRLVPLDEMAQMPMPILAGLDNIEKVRPEEIVTVVLPLKYIDASEASRAVAPMVSTFGSVTALGKGKGLIIMDRLSNIRRIRELLDNLELEPLVEQQLRTVLLKNASANEVAGIIRQLFGSALPVSAPAAPATPAAAAAAATAQQQQAGARAAQQAAARNRALAAQQAMAQSQGGIAQQGSLIVTADTRTNMILMVGSPDKLSLAEQVIERLDTTEKLSGGDIRIFKLANARAEEIAQTVQQVLGGGTTPVIRRPGVPVVPFTGTTEQVRVVADAATNRLIVSAPIDQMSKVEELIQDLDEAATMAEGVRIFQLSVADAQQLAGVITAASSQRDPRGRPSPTLSVTAEPQTNSLIIAGPAADIQRAAMLIDELDRPQEKGAREIHVVHLKSGDARQLSRSLINLFSQQQTGRRSGGASDLRVEAEAETNSLIISARPGDWPMVKELIDKLETTGTELSTPTTRLIMLEYANANEVASALSRIYSRRGRTGTASEVVIAPSQRNNSLLISASENEMQSIVPLIETMDTPSAEEVAPVQIIRLKSADANNLATQLQAMLPRQRSQQDIFIQADKLTNSVLIRAPQAERKMLEDMISQLDSVTQAEARELRILRLKNATADSLVKVLNELFNPSINQAARGRRPQEEIKTDEIIFSAGPGNLTLLVEAPKSKVEEIAQLVETLDQDENLQRVQIRTYQLRNANARELASSLAKLFMPQQRRPGAVAAEQDFQPRFEADTTSNQLMVAAPEEKFKEIEQLIEKLETSTVPASQTRMFRLKYASAADVTNLIKSIIGREESGAAGLGRRGEETQSEIRIATMASANTIVVKGSPGQLTMAEEIIKTFDTPDGSGKLVLEIVHLKNADAETLAQSVTQMIDSGRPATAARGPGRWMAAQSDSSTQAVPVTVTPEPNANALLVRGPEAEVPEVLALIHRLDEESTSTRIEMRVYPLKNGDATELTKALEKLFNEITRQQRRGTTQAPPFSVTADTRTNSLVVSSTATNFAIVEQLLKNLDQAPERPSRDVAYIWLENADAMDVVYKLEGMFSDRRKSDRPIIESDLFSNAITVIASEADLKQIEPIITKLDAAAKDNNVVVRVIPMKSFDAKRMAEVLQRLYSQMSVAPVVLKEQLPARRPATQPSEEEPMVTIAVDSDSNSLIISGTQRELDNIEMLIWDLTVNETGTESDIHILEIKQADPVSIAQILNELFNPTTTVPARVQTQQQRQPQQQPQQQQQQPQRNGQREDSRDDRNVIPTVKKEVIILPETRMRSLIVRAKQADYEMIASLVKQLDTVSMEISELRVFPLKNTNAKEVANNLQDIFQMSSSTTTPRPGSTARLSPQQMRAEAVRQMIAMQKGDESLQVDTTTAMTITPNEQSNSLIVAAPRMAMDLVGEIIQELDQSAATSATRIHIIKLTNGDAAEVAQMIRDLHDQQTQIARQNKQMVVDPLAVSADSRANAIILSTSQEMYEQVSQWIREVEDMKPSRGTLRIITLENADPAEVNEAIQKLYNSSSTGTPSPAGRRAATSTSTSGSRVETSVLTKQHAIMVKASDDEFEVIESLVKSLDKAAGEIQKQVRVFTLKNADNTQIAQALTRLYRTMARPGVQEDVVSIEALPQTSAVVVTASSEKMEGVAGLISQLDSKEVAPQLEFQIYPLQHAMPGKILPMLEQMVTQVQKLRPNDPITVQADERTRSIIVTASPTVFGQVEKIIQSLDKPPAYEVAEVLVIPLKRADAESLANLLNDMLKPAEGSLVTDEARALQEQIRRLRVRNSLSEDAPELDLTQPIKIQADSAKKDGSNALVITSTPDNLKAMKAIVEVMDTVPLAEGVKVRVLRMEHADAETVQKIIQNVFDQAAELGGKPGTTVAQKAVPDTVTGKGLVYPLTAVADLRTNSLILCGIEESLAVAEALVKDLDRVSGKNITEVQVFRLNHADAERLAEILGKVFSESTADPTTEGLRTHVTRLRMVLDNQKNQDYISEVPRGREGITFQADNSTSMIVVAARSDIMPLVADLIKTMDVPGAGSLNMVRFFPLKNADATRVKQVLDELHKGPNATLIRDEDKPTVAVDTRTNSLVISASDKTFAVMDVLLKRLDVEQPIDLREIRLISLENADAEAMAKILQEMVDARVERQEALGVDAGALKCIVMADVRTNSLIVGGSTESYDLVESLAKQLDSAPAALSGQIQIYPLDQANAGSLSQTLSKLFDERYDAARTDELKRQKPIILPDLRTNSLLLVANQDDSMIFQSLLKKLDVKLKDPTVQLVVLRLKHNDSGVVGPMLKDIFDARLKSMTPPDQTPAPQDQVDIVSEALSNSLIVSASKENLGLIEGLLEKVDVELPDETGLIKIYTLDNSDVERVGGMLKDLFSDGLYKPGLVGAADNRAITAREKVSIATDVRTNSLIVSASKENMAVINEIISRIDKMDDFGLLGDIRLYPLRRAKAVALADTLQKLFDSKRKAEDDTGSSGRSLAVSIIPDERTNSLLIAGGRESFKYIEKMVERLDSDQVEQITDIRVFTLENSDAEDLAEILTNVLTKKLESPQGSDDPRQALLQFVTKTREGQELIARALQEGVLIVPDRRTNSLVVSAQMEFMPVLESLITSLDNTRPRAAEIRVFALKNADATRMGEVLSSLFRLEQSASSGDMRSISYQMVTSQPSGRVPSAVVGSAQQYALNITVDQRTNSLLVAGTEQYVRLVESIIQELDASPAQERLTKVIRLRNARAGDIETALTSFLDKESERLVKTLGQDAVGAAQRLLEREVAVVSVASDGQTETANTLLLSASPRYFETVSQIIQELDQPPPQVLIQVLLAEVALKNTEELGFDWNYTNTKGDKTYSTGTNFGVQGQIATAGGFSVAVTGGDLRFFLQALQSTGRLEVLSRPQVLASDNKEAEIQVGQRVPFVTNSRVSDTGSVSNTIQYEDIGVILKVTPRINDDGFVRLEVSPEISTLSDSTVDISEGLKAVIVNSRSAKTTVNVQDGHTIVIGGLITTTDSNVEDKVPFLGDIPGLGLLFKTNKKVKERTELLIILTPHVLSNIAAADRETQRQFDGLEQIDEMGSDDLLKQRAMDPILHSRTMRARAGKKETEVDLEVDDDAPPVSLDRITPSEDARK